MPRLDAERIADQIQGTREELVGVADGERDRAERGSDPGGGTGK